MSFIRKTGAAVIAALGAIALAGAVTAADFEFELADEYPASSLPAQTDAHFIELVKEKTDGRVEITPHFGGALGYKSRDHYAAVRDGAIALASTPFDKLVGFEPIYALQSLPFLTPTIEQTEAMFEAAKPHYEEAFNKANQTLLLGGPWTPQGIWAKREIRSIDDLRGMKIRTYDVTGTRTLKDAGAAPIQLAWGDVMSALSTNTIEGVLTSDEGGVSASFWELGARYFNFLGYTMGINAVTMNLDAYNALPPELQRAIREAAAEAEEHAWRVVRERVAHNKRVMDEHGAVFIEDVPREVIDHLMKAGAPLIDEWKAEMGAEAEAILAEYEKRMTN